MEKPFVFLALFVYYEPVFVVLAEANLEVSGVRLWGLGGPQIWDFGLLTTKGMRERKIIDTWFSGFLGYPESLNGDEDTEA